MMKRKKVLMSLIMGLFLTGALLIYPPKKASALNCPSPCWDGWENRLPNGTSACPMFGEDMCCFGCGSSDE